MKICRYPTKLINLIIIDEKYDNLNLIVIDKKYDNKLNLIYCNIIILHLKNLSEKMQESFLFR